MKYGAMALRNEAESVKYLHDSGGNEGKMSLAICK